MSGAISEKIDPVPAVNLVVVAHPDDEVLAMGGTGAKLSGAGQLVQPVMLCGQVEARGSRPQDAELVANIKSAMGFVGFADPVLGDFPNIKLNTVPHLDLVQFIEKQILQFKPQRIFTHHSADLNDDHKYTAEAAMVAARLSFRRDDIQPINSVHLMETPSATDWSYAGVNRSFEPNEFVDISETLEAKLRACHAYKGVMRAPPHSRSSEVIQAMATARGGQSGLRYAEAFQTIFRRDML